VISLLAYAVFSILKATHRAMSVEIESLRPPEKAIKSLELFSTRGFAIFGLTLPLYSMITALLVAKQIERLPREKRCFALRDPIWAEDAV